MNGKIFLQLLLLTACICLALSGRAQSSGDTLSRTTNVNQWFLFIGDFHPRADARWFADVEGHVRFANFGENWQQWLIRPAVHYRVNSWLEAAVGYTWLRNFAYGDQPVSHVFPEHNVWQQLLVRHKLAGIPFYHRLRIEERFIGVELRDAMGEWNLDHFKTADRFRYRIGGKLAGKGSLEKYSLSVFNEAFVDMKQSAGGYVLNQNWLYAGIGKKICARQQLDLGYQYQWIRKGNGFQRENNHTMQLTWKVAFGPKG